MKSIRLLMPLLLLLAISACKSGKGGQGGKDPNGGKALPAEIAALYKQDAARLAVREISTSTVAVSAETEANIPADRLNHFLDILTKVHWLCAKSDTIPDLSGIRTLGNPHLRRVNVILHPDAPMLENWSQGLTTTSDLYLNQLLSRYACKVKEFRQSAAGPSLVIEAGRDINTIALAEALSHNNGIKMAEAETVMGDGNNIEWGGEGKNQMALRYSIGAGDCPSGCIQRKFWIFYVSATGEVTYMGTRGNIPKEMEPKE